MILPFFNIKLSVTYSCVIVQSVCDSFFLTYEIESLLFLVVLESSVLPVGRDTSVATLKATSEV